MPMGTVKWFNAKKGFGFIRPQDALSVTTPDVFVHISASILGYTYYSQLFYNININTDKMIKRIIKRINDKLVNKEDHTQLSLQLRGLLRENLSANKEELALKEKFDLVRCRWDKVKAILAHYETTDYSLNNYVYSSNRVNRAATLKENEDGEFFGWSKHLKSIRPSLIGQSSYNFTISSTITYFMSREIQNTV